MFLQWHQMTLVRVHYISGWHLADSQFNNERQTVALLAAVACDMCLAAKKLFNPLETFQSDQFVPASYPRASSIKHSTKARDPAQIFL